MDISSAWTTGRIALGAGALMIATASGAHAAPLSQAGATWLAPTSLSATGAWTGEVRTVGDTNNGIAVWASGRAGAWRIEAARARSGAIAQASDISGTLSATPHPDAAVSGTNAVVAWEAAAGVTVRTATGEGFAPAVNIASTGATRPSVAIDVQGRTWVAWTQGDGIYVARKDGGWQSLGRIIAATSPRTVDITAHGDGIAMAWSQPASTAARPRWTVRAALVTGAGIQDVDLDLASSVSAPQPRVASGGGLLGVVWRREGFIGPNADYYADSVQVATHAGSWSRTQVHAPRVAMRVIHPEIAISAQGEMAITYTRSAADITTTDYQVAGMLLGVRTRASNGTWSGESTIMYSRHASHTVMNTAAMNARPRFDATGGLGITWIQTASASNGTPVAASAARNADGSWSLRAITPEGVVPEWVTLLPAPDGQESVAIWRRHLGGGVFDLAASRFAVPPAAVAPPAQSAPAPAPAPAPVPGPIGPVDRSQVKRDAAVARQAAQVRGPAPTITITLRRAGRVTIHLRPVSRSAGSATRWQVRAARGTTRIRLDRRPVAAGRYRVEARVGTRVIARRSVTITRRVSAMAAYRAQTGWIAADSRIIAVDGNRVTLDLISSAGGAGSWFGTTIDIAPGFEKAIGTNPMPTTPVRISLDVSENTRTIYGTVFAPGRMLRVLISGAATLDPEAISMGQMVEASNNCFIANPCA